MKEQFLEKKFQANTMKMIKIANEIIAEYQQAGFILTIRQLYYQFVARGHVSNSMKTYKMLVSIINDARLAGFIDWDAIEDRTRFLRKNSHWETGADIIDSCVYSFAVDKWNNQEVRPEVWIEKDALIGVIEKVCRQYDVPYFACRGYASQSELWRAGHRFRNYLRCGQRPIIIHLGDHDPSGIDMTRDNQFRIEMFAKSPIEIRRIALNWDQIQKYDPPPNPTKMTDSRADGYVQEFGHESWELDALDPVIISDLIDTTIDNMRNPDRWDERVILERTIRDELKKVYEDFIDKGI